MKAKTIPAAFVAPALLLAARLAAVAADAPTKSIDAAAPTKPYPLKFCVVSHEPLAGQSAPVEFVYAGWQIKVANAECAATFRAEPNKYLKAIENAEDVLATAKGFKWVEPAAFEKLRVGSNVVVLDVRSAAEFAAGHVPGALNLDVNATNFAAKASSLDKSKTYLVNCMAGVRGAKACDALHRLEFPTLYNLDGGLKAWERAGNQPVKEFSAPNQTNHAARP